MHHLTRASLANRPVVALLTLLLMAVGVFAAGSLKQELFPSLELPSAAVVASYPGAAPDILERQVTSPIEDAVKDKPSIRLKIDKMFTRLLTGFPGNNNFILTMTENNGLSTTKTLKYYVPAN